MSSIVRPMPSEVRYVTGMELRSAEADGRYLETIVTTYGDWKDVGPFEERMTKGVFDTSLSRHADTIKLVVGHDDMVPAVGTPVEWRRADDHLAAVYKFGTHQEARTAAQQAAEGMFGGVSVSFLPGRKPGDSVWEKVSSNHVRVTRNQARLLHVGLVTTPANADSALLAVRSAGVPEEIVTPHIDEARRRLEELKARWDANA